MILFLSVCFLTLPGYCLLQETEELFDDISSSHFVFPKDRNSTSSLSTRIIGGTEATAHSYPFQAALYVYMSSQTYFCGGTLISRSWILTAAHCVSDDPLYVQVTLGAHNLSSSESTMTVLTSTTFIVHGEWDSTTLQNDIALVMLPTDVTLSDAIATISFASGNQTYENEIGTTIGWGLTETGGTTVSAVLKQVDATIISNEACALTDSDYQQVIVDSHLCTSGVGIVGSCSGDSGGPLIVNGVQVGIVSFGSTDCSSGKPSVFARLTSYSDWIEQYVSDIDDAEVEVKEEVNEEGSKDGCDAVYRNAQFLVGVCIAFCLFQFYMSVSCI